MVFIPPRELVVREDMDVFHCMDSGEQELIHGSPGIQRESEMPVLVTVDQPMTEYEEGEGTFTTYQIILQTINPAFTLEKSCVRRRYSDFLWLQKSLQAHHSHIHIPTLPGKTCCIPKLTERVVLSRKEHLLKFLQEVVSETQFLSDTSVHLFLQTPLSTAEMDRYLLGKIHKQVPDIVKTCDRLFHISNIGDLGGRTHNTFRPSETSTPRTMPQAVPQASFMSSTPHGVFSPTRPHSPIPTHSRQSPVLFTVGTTSADSGDHI